MLHLASVKYQVSHYMCDGHDERTAIHLVEASSIDEAYDKVRKHYESMTSEYSVYYRIVELDIEENIK